MSVAESQFAIGEAQEPKNQWVAIISKWEESRNLIAEVTLGVFLATALIVLIIPSSYQATARLMPPDKQQLGGIAAMLAAAGEGEGAAGSGVGGMLADTLGVKSSGALYVGVLRSTTVASLVVNQFDLQKVYRKRYAVDAREQLLRNTEVAEDRKSGIIGITVTDHSPQRAAQIAAAYVETLNQLMAQLNTSAAHRQRVFIEDRLRTAKQELDTADKDLSVFSSKNLTLDVKEQGKAMVEGAATLEEELIASESQLSEIEQIYSPNNVRARSLQARVNLLKRKLAEFRGTPGDTSMPAAGAGDVGISISRLPMLGVTYYDLFRRAKIQEIVYETLTKQYELTKIEEAKELPSIKLLDKPEIPEIKSGPARTRIVIITTLLAFFLALGWVWLRERWHNLPGGDTRKLVLRAFMSMISRIVRPGRMAIEKRLWRHEDGS